MPTGWGCLGGGGVSAPRAGAHRWRDATCGRLAHTLRPSCSPGRNVCFQAALSLRISSAITGIDGNVTINRALWVLAEEMRKLKAA